MEQITTIEGLATALHFGRITLRGGEYRGYRYYGNIKGVKPSHKICTKEQLPELMSQMNKVIFLRGE